MHRTADGKSVTLVREPKPGGRTTRARRVTL